MDDLSDWKIRRLLRPGSGKNPGVQIRPKIVFLVNDIWVISNYLASARPPAWRENHRLLSG